jgi:hypothetical protein
MPPNGNQHPGETADLYRRGRARNAYRANRREETGITAETGAACACPGEEQQYCVVSQSSSNPSRLSQLLMCPAISVCGRPALIDREACEIVARKLEVTFEVQARVRHGRARSLRNCRRKS